MIAPIFAIPYLLSDTSQRLSAPLIRNRETRNSIWDKSAQSPRRERGEHNNSLWSVSLPQEDAAKPEVPGGFARTAKIPAALDGHVPIVDVLERATKSTAQPLVGSKLSEQHAKLEFARRRRRVEQLSKFAGSSRRGPIEWQLQGEQRWDVFFHVVTLIVCAV